MVGSVCHLKRFTTGSRNTLKEVRKLQICLPGGEVAETTVKKFRAAGFGALVKRWDNCISDGGGYIEK
jgi:hypothetical protein